MQREYFFAAWLTGILTVPIGNHTIHTTLQKGGYACLLTQISYHHQKPDQTSAQFHIIGSTG